MLHVTDARDWWRYTLSNGAGSSAMQANLLANQVAGRSHPAAGLAQTSKSWPFVTEVIRPKQAALREFGPLLVHDIFRPCDWITTRRSLRRRHVLTVHLKAQPLETNYATTRRVLCLLALYKSLQKTLWWD